MNNNPNGHNIRKGQIWRGMNADGSLSRRFVIDVRAEKRTKGGKTTTAIRIYWTRSIDVAIAHENGDDVGTKVWLDSFCAWIDATSAEVIGGASGGWALWKEKFGDG